MSRQWKHRINCISKIHQNETAAAQACDQDDTEENGCFTGEANVEDDSSEGSFSWSYPRGNESDEDGSSYVSEGDGSSYESEGSFSWSYPKGNESDEDGSSYENDSDR